MTAQGNRVVPPQAASPAFIARERTFAARNYDPLPVVLSHGEGAWITDVDGRRYLDLMSAYSAVSFGHAHPAIVGALVAQARELAVTSRAFFNDKLPLLLERITRAHGPAARDPLERRRGGRGDRAQGVAQVGLQREGRACGSRPRSSCASSNFHGRSITIVGFSSEAQYRDGFGPFTPGFKAIPYGDAAALDAAITPNTAAFLVEPVQGEGGILVPPDGYLAECARICRAAARAADLRRDPDRPRAHRPRPRVPSTTT